MNTIKEDYKSLIFLEQVRIMKKKYHRFVKTNGSVVGCLYDRRGQAIQNLMAKSFHSVIGRSNNQIQKSTAGIFKAATKKDEKLSG